MKQLNRHGDPEEIKEFIEEALEMDLSDEENWVSTFSFTFLNLTFISLITLSRTLFI